jgi:bla regulator protein blaR1
MLWMFGVAVCGARLIGGWAVAQRIRRHARTLEDGSAHIAATVLQQRLSRSHRVLLLESQEVEAPMVVGGYRPALIIPVDVTAHLSAGALSALLSHKFAHIRRGDYTANLVQSAYESLLFFPRVRVDIRLHPRGPGVLLRRQRGGNVR